MLAVFKQTSGRGVPLTQALGPSNLLMKPNLFSVIAATTAAIVLPPLLLIPMIYHLPSAQVFKDLYEACLWISPSIGVAALIMLFRLSRTDTVTFRDPAMFSAVILACLDIVSPVLFYILLALIAGH
jgi:hypothetical protein